MFGLNVLYLHLYNKVMANICIPDYLDKNKVLLEVARETIKAIVDTVMIEGQPEEFWKTRYIDLTIILGQLKAELKDDKKYDLRGLNENSEVYKVYNLINQVKDIVYGKVQ
jgi:hypothetical protein